MTTFSIACSAYDVINTNVPLTFIVEIFRLIFTSSLYLFTKLQLNLLFFYLQKDSVTTVAVIDECQNNKKARKKQIKQV